MKKSDVYRTMALAYYTPRDERTKLQNARVTGWSVCEVIRHGTNWRRSPIGDTRGILNDVELSMPKGKGEWDYAFENRNAEHAQPYNDLLRADWCYMMYLISKEEEENG